MANLPANCIEEDGRLTLKQNSSVRQTFRIPHHGPDRPSFGEQARVALWVIDVHHEGALLRRPGLQDSLH